MLLKHSLLVADHHSNRLFNPKLGYYTILIWLSDVLTTYKLQRQSLEQRQTHIMNNTMPIPDGVFRGEWLPHSIESYLEVSNWLIG